MQELSLYGAVPSSKHHLVLSILAGLTSMQPQPVLERRLQFIPTREPGTPATANQRVQFEKKGVPKAFIGDTFRVQVVGDVNESSAHQAAGPDGSDFERFAFRCEFKDFPAVPQTRPATSRVFEIMRMVEGSKRHVLDFMDSAGFRFTNEMLLEGERFTYGNIDLRLLRTYALPPAPAPIDVAPKKTGSLTALDASGSYAVHASLLVGDDNKPEIMSSAFDEMQRLRTTLKGIVELELGDRLFMNTRLKREIR